MKVHLKNKHVPGVTRCGRSNAHSQTTTRPEDVTCGNCKRTFKPLHRKRPHYGKLHWPSDNGWSLCGHAGNDQMMGHARADTKGEVTCKHCIKIMGGIPAVYEEDEVHYRRTRFGDAACGTQTARLSGDPDEVTCALCRKTEAWKTADVAINHLVGGLATPSKKAVYELDLPKERPGTITKFRVGNWPGYCVVTDYKGKPAEIFVHCSKEGSLVKGMLDAIAISISIGLRSGVDPAKYVKSLSDMRFEPNGYAQLGDRQGVQVTSIVDALMKILVAKYPDLSPSTAQPPETSSQQSEEP